MYVYNILYYYINAVARTLCNYCITTTRLVPDELYLHHIIIYCFCRRSSVGTYYMYKYILLCVNNNNTRATSYYHYIVPTYMWLCVYYNIYIIIY